MLLEKPNRALLAKVWGQHVIAHLGDDNDLLHVGRHLLHDLGGRAACSISKAAI